MGHKHIQKATCPGEAILKPEVPNPEEKQDGFTWRSSVETPAPAGEAGYPSPLTLVFHTWKGDGTGHTPKKLALVTLACCVDDGLEGRGWRWAGSQLQRLGPPPRPGTERAACCRRLWGQDPQSDRPGKHIPS